MIWNVGKVINVVNNHTLDDIKRGLEKYLGRDVVVRAHRGRKKFEKKRAFWNVRIQMFLLFPMKVMITM